MLALRSQVRVSKDLMLQAIVREIGKFSGQANENGPAKTFVSVLSVSALCHERTVAIRGLCAQFVTFW
jgi:hypothetical protein